MSRTRCGILYAAPQSRDPGLSKSKLMGWTAPYGISVPE